MTTDTLSRGFRLVDPTPLSSASTPRQGLAVFLGFEYNRVVLRSSTHLTLPRLPTLKVRVT